MPTRRHVAAGLAALALAPARPPGTRAASSSLPPRPARATPAVRREPLTLVAQERDSPVLGPGRPTSRVWSYGPAGSSAGGPALPILRAEVGEILDVTLENRLSEHTSIHWHGLRLPAAMDGVPYLTQPPVLPGQRFAYSFPLLDTGTYFLHPHCNETGQSGRGLAAVLVVTGDEPPGTEPDADLVVAVKDWRLAADGSFLPFETREGAGRAGTFGTVRGVNGTAGPLEATVPAGGDVRLRLLNLDGTRIVQLGIEGGDAAVIATDGHGVAPFPLDTWRLGPAMRLDVLARAPRAGETLRVVDYGSAEPWTVAILTAAGPDRERPAFAPAGLYAPSVPTADAEGAERRTFTFSAAAGPAPEAEILNGLPPDDPLARVLLDSLCVRDTSLWAINKVAWPSAANPVLPPPLGELVAGRSYVFELVNVTPHPHPIHLHGHAFQVLSSNRRTLPRFTADTVILNPRERVEIAFVAAAGDWMLHCHILEHLDFGMMGYLRVA